MRKDMLSHALGRLLAEMDRLGQTTICVDRATVQRLHLRAEEMEALLQQAEQVLLGGRRS